MRLLFRYRRIGIHVGRPMDKATSSDPRRVFLECLASATGNNRELMQESPKHVLEDENGSRMSGE